MGVLVRKWQHQVGWLGESYTTIKGQSIRRSDLLKQGHEVIVGGSKFGPHSLIYKEAIVDGSLTGFRHVDNVDVEAPND